MNDSTAAKNVRQVFFCSSLVLTACLGAPIDVRAEPGGITNASAVQSKRAVISIKAAASRGDPEAMYLLAMLHVEGKMPEADYDEGMRWLKKSAAKGNRDAQRMYAFMDSAFSGEGC
jgi:TPR repeat protein